MGIIGKIAAMFSEKFTKSISAFLGIVVGLIVGQIFGWLAVKGFGSCGIVMGDNICTVTFGSYHWTSTQVTEWLSGVLVAWIGTHAVAAAPANKPS